MNIEKKYDEKYGNVSNDKDERYLSIINSSKTPDKLIKEVDNQIKIINNIEWGEYNYTIYLLPKATPRPRTTSKGNFFYVKGASDNKKYFLNKIMKSDWEIICTPTIFDCKCYFPIPNNFSKLDTALSELGYINYISMPDFDNLAKTYTDMIKDILLYDDRLIIKGTTEKSYSLKPRIEVNIKYMKTHDSNMNKKKIEKCINNAKKIKKGRKK